MSSTAPSQLQSPYKPRPPKKDKERKRDAHHERLKSVVRRLPPNLPEDVFWGSVAQWVTDESVAWRVFCPGKLRKRLGKESTLSRAYIAFRSEEQLKAFGREYDGHLFRDKNGSEYQAVVEYAPYQKIPSEKKKVDARNNTIEKDEDYISFVASLKASESTEPASLESLLAATQPQPAPKTTPLLEALKAEKSAHKDKEAILRSHAHYKDKDPTILVPPPRGAPTEPKKKGGAKPVAAPAAPESSSAGAGKKGKNAGQAPVAAQAQGHAKGQGQQAGKPPAKPAKAPRAPKPAKAPKQPAPAGVVAIAAPPAAGAVAQAPVPAPRRTRPVIGLASRHFEAAISGVAGGARARREQQQAGVQKEGAAGSTSASAAGPPSPRRARREKAKEGGGGRAQSEGGRRGRGGRGGAVGGDGLH